MRNPTEIQVRYGTAFYYDEFSQLQKTERKNFLLILKSYSRNCDSRFVIFMVMSLQK